MNPKRILPLSLLLLLVASVVFGCSDASTGSAESSGPTSAGEGAKLKNQPPAPPVGSVAGGTGTGQ